MKTITLIFLLLTSSVYANKHFIEFIAQEEGHSLVRYQDTNGWAVGYGFNKIALLDLLTNESLSVDEEKIILAYILCLDYDNCELVNKPNSDVILIKLVGLIKKRIVRIFPEFVNYNVYKQTAVVSVVYNYGVGGFKRTRLFNALKTNTNINASWNSLQHKPRRARELALFNTKPQPAKKTYRTGRIF